MRLVPFCVAVLSVLASPAFAHPVLGAGSSFDAGLVGLLLLGGVA